jgi:parallel beta-helix repeat protein
MDDNSSVVEIGNNTVANCVHSGVFIHNSHEIEVHGNTLYNNGTQLLLTHDPIAPHNPIRNVDLTNNTIITGRRDQYLAFLATISNDITDFGKIDSNCYYALSKDNNGIFTSENGIFGLLGFHDWQSRYGKDAVSRSGAGKSASYAVSRLVGPNKFANEGFDANISGVGNYSFQHNSKVAWSNDGKLDGGALRFDFTSVAQANTSTYVTFKTDPVVTGKNYILKFSLVGMKDKQTFRVFLRQSSGPYHTISNINYALIRTGRTENELLFSATASENNAIVVFELTNADSTFWVDNVRFYEAAVQIARPDDRALFKYNQTGAAKAVDLQGSYIDACGRKYAHRLKLDPYSSAVLIKDPEPTN